MQNHVIFLQGGGTDAYSEDAELVTSLKKGLGSKYSVSYPAVPNEENPEYESWKQTIARATHNAAGKLLYVAHSLGAYFLIKYLTEEKISKEPAAIFLIAPPFPGGDENWKYEGFNLIPSFGKRLSKSGKVFLYHSLDDEVVPFAHMGMYASEIPRVTTRETVGGHQLKNDLSVVVDDIKDL